MPTWKLKIDDELLFHHLCAKCDQRMADGLLKADWVKIRDNEPVVCGECSRKCGLTVRALWGADEKSRYAVCAQCAELPTCPLQGRYYC
ncbi:MAG TPA: hypothetical protein ENN98_08305 [Desulfurivibrio alkaliphilus]|uniref:Uncharacterized protein n=1 Tax=Desulfurivibrio alkaliphilus TaxID=427923 RepID=A0A7C2TKQ2_9BACT|nr:hypothetical protein [Desulfurivibrio alkaliphilus]